MFTKDNLCSPPYSSPPAGHASAPAPRQRPCALLRLLCLLLLPLPLARPHTRPELPMRQPAEARRVAHSDAADRQHCASTHRLRIRAHCKVQRTVSLFAGITHRDARPRMGLGKQTSLLQSTHPTSLVRKVFRRVLRRTSAAAFASCACRNSVACSTAMARLASAMLATVSSSSRAITICKALTQETVHPWQWRGLHLHYLVSSSGGAVARWASSASRSWQAASCWSSEQTIAMRLLLVTLPGGYCKATMSVSRQPQHTP